MGSNPSDGLVAELKARAKEIRKDVLIMLHQAGSGHTGGSLSAVELVVALFFARMRHDPKDPCWQDRDRLVLSKGHAAPLLYATLAHAGYFERQELATLRRLGSRLQGHTELNLSLGVETSAGARRQDLVVLDGDLSSSTRTMQFAQQYPDRFFNMGVAEQDMIGTAAGLALGGMTPFVSSFAIFLVGKPWEQIRQSICHMNLNVKLVSSHAGITVGPDGASHQCLEDLALMMALPKMRVIVPADAIEAKGAFLAALEEKGPFYIRGSRLNFPAIMGAGYQFRLGSACTVRPGSDVTLMACGVMVPKALLAAYLLKKDGISARVVNISTLKPLDEEKVIEAARETGAIVTAEEHNIYGGLGSLVSRVLGQYYPVPVEIVAVQDRFGTSAQPEELLIHYGLTEHDIAAKARKALQRKRK